MNYLFILGNHPELSIAEIKSLFNYLSINASFLSVSTRILQVNPAYPQEELCGVNPDSNIPDSFIAKLGGTIKITKVFKKVSSLSNQIIIDFLKTQKVPRLDFGLNVYNLNFEKKDFLNLGKNIKHGLRKANIKSNFILPQNGQELSSVVVSKKILNKNGYDFTILKYKDNYIYSVTEAVQDFKRYSELDYGIPSSDPRSGMLPPKLAQMMINLGLPDKNDENLVIYDPFCGRGRIILQSLVLGFKNIYGSDIDIKAVDGSRKNARWLSEKIGIKINDDFFQKNIFLQDVINPIKLSSKSIDAIITEPFLGPSYKTNPTSEEIEKVYYKLEKLYLQSFQGFRLILKENAKVVFVFPKINGQSLLERLVDKISALGYYKLTSFTYARDYQIVKREIVVFKFKS